MTEDEVTAILGPPSVTATSTGTFNGNPYQMKTLAWKHYIPNKYIAYITITVIIRNEMVTGKCWKQIVPLQK